MIYLIEDGTLTDIADAIREKTSSTAPILTTDMPDKIRSISGGGGGSGGINGSCIDYDTPVISVEVLIEIGPVGTTSTGVVVEG